MKNMKKDIDSIREEMKYKFREVLSKIDTEQIIEF